MKKLLAILALLFTTLSSHAQFSKLGDINHDGNVTVTDVTEIVNIILRAQTPFYLELSLKVGETSTLNIMSGSGSYSVQSGNANIVSATLNGNKVLLTAVGGGTTNITVTDTANDLSAIIDVTVNTNTSPISSSCPDDNHPHMIDLGLPSGTKWACCNVGATTPYDYGGLCAWGETYMKSSFRLKTYTLCNGTYDSMRDIGTNISGTQYDIAKAKWGSDWQLPTKDQFNELKNNTSLSWTTINGVNGCIFTSNTGNSIFMPVAGFGYLDDLRNIGASGYYMSSTRHSSYNYENYGFYFYSGGSHEGYTFYRWEGLSVRPVSTNTQYSSLILSSNSVEITGTESSNIQIISGSGLYSVQSSDENVANATVSGHTITINALGDGTTIITVTDNRSGQTATISVTVNIATFLTCPDDNHPHMIDLGLPSGTKWACCNVGATSPEGYGGYYAWGEMEEKDYYGWENYSLCDGTAETCQDIGNDIAGTQYDVATVKWGEMWQMPNLDQCDELVKKCTREYISINNIFGTKFVGPNGGSIFMPYAGLRYEDRIIEVGLAGQYWESVLHKVNGVYRIKIARQFIMEDYSISADLNCHNRHAGLTVRPVSR